MIELVVRILTVLGATAGAYLIYDRLPGLLDPTPWTDFPIVSIVVVIFAWLTVAELAAAAIRWMLPRA